MQLEKLVEDCRKQTLACTVFREPDIGNEVTAVAIEPSPKTKRLVARLPLLLKSNSNESKYNNIGHESKTGQLYQENSLQETSSNPIRQGKAGNLRPNLWSKLADALRIKRLQKQKEGESSPEKEKRIQSSD